MILVAVTLFEAAAAGALPAVANRSTFTPTASHCPKATNYHALDKGRKIAPRKLGELPPANAYNAVYRLVNGCEVPVIVRYNLGRR